MKQVLIVGASRGIGLELVRQYRADGDAVTATARSDDGLARLQALGARLALMCSRMGSIGLRTSTAGWLYRASKAALNSVLKDASLVLAGRAVCVALHPGWVRTDMGGADAALAVADSVAGMRRTLAGLLDADNGGFFGHDGRRLDW